MSLQPHNESSLLRQLAAGNETAFQTIYDEFSARLYHFARRFVMQDAEAEDITSEAFIKLWTARKNFSSINAIAVFLHTTVKNKCLDYLKHEKIKRARKDELIQLIENTKEGDFSHELILLAVMKKIYEEVDQLPARQREIFYLSYKEGLKPAQIAEKLNVSVQTVKNQRLSAIRLLQATLKNHPLMLSLLAMIELECYLLHS